MRKKRYLALALVTALTASLTLGACGKKEEESSQAAVDSDTFINLALNVYYNDADHDYYANEAGQTLTVYGEGQYSLTFDCASDLSEEAKAAGVTSLTNLTSVYILDMDAADGKQSPLTAANIMFDSVTVDDTALTITQTEPKSAFKASGIFDTNDPINAWDGSQVEEVSATSDHVANFTTVENPTKITVTFTLSDMVWEAIEEESSEAAVSANTYVNEAVFSDMDFTDVSAKELTAYLGNGINLGNTMEAYGRATLGTTAEVSAYETYWGQPITTEAMVKAMKNCGFDTLRIPVAWTNMIDYESGDYTINTAYLDRVEEIVNYALDSEMFVILNDHWDGGWWAMFGEEDTKEEAWDLYESIWTQLSERFADYSDMLIFESANEELGNSLNDSGKLTEDECYELTNQINQKFVDIVRASGGNNDDRFLLIAGYNTDIAKTCDDRFAMPSDSAKDKLFISVHYYTPWNYCGAEQDAEWGTVSEYNDMTDLLTQMEQFTDAGYGVIIGEYAALPYWVDGVSYLKSDTTEFTSYFLDNCDLEGYCPVLWSVNDLFKKDTLTMASDELTELFTSRCYAEETAAGDSYMDTVTQHMADALAAAPESRNSANAAGYTDGDLVAYIMWNGGAGTYSVGDAYNPDDCTEGITATDAVIDGAGTYTVSLDFAGGNTGLTFAALGIAGAEVIYPGCYINITSITFDGEEVPLTARPYTTSDDGTCTRVNLVNEWVNELPEEARVQTGNLTGCSPVIFDKSLLDGTKNITITFEFVTE